MPFETRRLANHPILKLKAAGQEIIYAFDTGQDGNLKVTDSYQKQLLRKKMLLPIGDNARGDTLYTLKNLEFNKDLVIGIPAIEFAASNQILPFKKGLGTTEPNTLTLGFRFLDQFKTIWEYDSGRIYVLKR